SYNPRANEHLVYFIATLYGFVESDKPYYHSLISDATRLDIDKRSFSPWWTNIPSLGRIYPAVHFIEMDITNLATTSTEQFVADLNISMYPNPVENTINLTYNLEKSSSVIATEVMDYTGRILDKKSFNNSNASGVINYDVTNIPSGSYFLKIRLEDNSYTVLKFVKI
ncbi:MAG TPA: T9SS type A sorting domain-containing protein, partial [Saprospiraceae bacterium]|nr:T9SS type A sorting domain-containing protein [Saprospiraceae bacterium]